MKALPTGLRHFEKIGSRKPLPEVVARRRHGKIGNNSFGKAQIFLLPGALIQAGKAVQNGKVHFLGTGRYQRGSSVRVEALHEKPGDALHGVECGLVARVIVPKKKARH